MPPDPADLRAHAAALRDRLAELDADHRDRTQSLRDDLRRVTDLLTRHAQPDCPPESCDMPTGRLISNGGSNDSENHGVRVDG